LIKGRGAYDRNLVSTQYMEWFESKPFNFSAVFALAMKELRRMRVTHKPIDPTKVGEILLRSSAKNVHLESSIGLIRVLPITVFSLKFSEPDFEQLIKGTPVTTQTSFS
jgi:hypothetical protein